MSVYKLIEFILHLILETPYYIGEVNTLCTFPNKIEDKSECQEAVIELENLGDNLVYKRDESESTWPSGCYGVYNQGSSNTDVYWNNFRSGDKNPYARPICKRNGKYNYGIFRGNIIDLYWIYKTLKYLKKLLIPKRRRIPKATNWINDPNNVTLFLLIIGWLFAF